MIFSNNEYNLKIFFGICTKRMRARACIARAYIFI